MRRLIYFIEESFYPNFISFIVIFLLLVGMQSCKRNQIRVDAWKYQEGLGEQVCIDTIQESRKFNNRFLSDIIFIDSIMPTTLSSSSIDTVIVRGDYIIKLSIPVEVKIEPESFLLYRGDISGGKLYQNLPFIYEKNIGVVAYLSYGYGDVKLVSREEGNKQLNVNQSLYEKMYESSILFPALKPDTLIIYDIFNPGDIQ